MGSIDNGGRKVITQKMILEATPGSILASVRIDHEFSVLKVGNVGDWAVYSVNHWGDDKDSPAFATVALETIEHHCASFGSKRISRVAFQIFRSEERRVGKECSVTCRSRWSPYH